MRTQVGIVGAGPAGLVLSHLLAREGIDCIILENRSRDYVESRVRAGVLEQGTVDLLTELGVADRLHRECMIDRFLDIRFAGGLIHLDLPGLSDGKVATIYGQQEVVKDLIAARAFTASARRPSPPSSLPSTTAFSLSAGSAFSRNRRRSRK
jgi:p-hydroxybenzoate 3-monooxygenase